MDLECSLHSNRTGKDEMLGMDDSRRQSLFKSSHKEKDGYSCMLFVMKISLISKSRISIGSRSARSRMNVYALKRNALVNIAVVSSLRERYA